MLKNAFIMSVGFGLAGCAVQQGGPLDDGQNRVVDIVNTGAVPLAFFAVNAERSRLFQSRPFQARVAAQPVGANSYATVNFDDGSGACLYTLFASAESGAKAEAARFDVCREVVWVVAPEMLQ